MIDPHKLLAATTFVFMVLYLAIRLLSGCVLTVEVEAPKDPIKIDHQIVVDASVEVHGDVQLNRPDGGIL